MTETSTTAPSGRPRKPRLLVISRQSIFPGVGGSEAYSFDFLRYAAGAGWEITGLITHAMFAGGVPEYRVAAVVPKVMRVHVPGCVRVGTRLVRPRLWLRETARGFLRRMWKTKFPPRRYPLSWSTDIADARECRLAAEWIARVQPDVVLANYCWMTPCFDAPGKFLKVVLTHDVMHEKVASFAAQGMADSMNYPDEAMEGKLLARADLLLAISENEATSFRKLLPGANIRTMPKAAHSTPLRGEVVPGRCVFVGSGYAANVQGLKWFLEHAWLLITELMPNATLGVCGKVCGELSAVPSGVELLGQRDDLRDDYAKAAVVIVPLLAGSGIKIKMVEALGYGKACVTTSVGAQGLGFLGPQAFQVADEPGDFAMKVLEILRDETWRATLEAAATEAVERGLEPGAVYGSVLRELESSLR